MDIAANVLSASNVSGSLSYSELS